MLFIELAQLLAQLLGGLGPVLGLLVALYLTLSVGTVGGRSGARPIWLGGKPCIRGPIVQAPVAPARSHFQLLGRSRPETRPVAGRSQSKGEREQGSERLAARPALRSAAQEPQVQQVQQRPIVVVEGQQPAAPGRIR